MLLAAAQSQPNPTATVNIVYLIVATLVSAGIIYAAFRNSIRHMVERVVDERIAVPIERIGKRIDDHMLQEEVALRERDAVIQSTARDVAYLRGRWERGG